MNTKHTKVVVTWFLAIATLAAMGFRAPNDGHLRVIAADVATCDLGAASSFSAYEFIKELQAPCFSDIVDAVEADAWDSAPVRFVARSASSNASYIDPADVAAIVQQNGSVHPSDILSLLASGD